MAITVKKLLNRLGKMDAYDYPIGDYSLYMLPNGKLIGKNGIMEHDSVLEDILKRKLKSVQEFYDIMVAIKTIRITIESSMLYVDMCVPYSMDQKQALQGLYMSGKYNIIFNQPECIPGAPSDKYCRRMIGMPLYD